MKGRIKELLTGCNRKQILMLELDGDFRTDYDALNGADVEITVKRWREKRSLDANAYCWVLIGKLAEALRLPKGDIYKDAIRRIGGVSEIICIKTEALPKLRAIWEGKGSGWQVEEIPSKLPGCTNAVLYYGSSVYDTHQMSLLIDNLVQQCEDQGIPTITPNELERLKSQWGYTPKECNT